MFPAGSPIRRAARAVNAIPMAGRTVLMELARPAIAAAVNDHDHFRRTSMPCHVAVADGQPSASPSPAPLCPPSDDPLMQALTHGCTVSTSPARESLPGRTILQ